MEPGVVQLESGGLWCYIRTELGYPWESFSSDRGLTWNLPRPSLFTAPASPMCVKRLSDGRPLAVWNPIPNYNGRSETVKGVWTAGRSPLALAVLDREENPVHPYQTVEGDEESGFCYTVIFKTAQGDVLLGYCAGGVSDGCCLNRLRIRKIYKNELEL